MLRTVSRRVAARIFQQVQRPSSTVPSATAASRSDDGKLDAEISSKKPAQAEPITNENRSKMVSAAFASLKQAEVPKKTSLDDRILAAKDPETLLSLSETVSLSKKQVLRIVTTLAEWSVSGQADMMKFETDPRFISLCQVLGRTTKRPQSVTSSAMSTNKTGDLSLVLGVTGDDEAAKLISSITLPQMVKVMVSLAFKKRRSIPLLRALSFNISQSTASLDIKQAADVMYVLASLNFPDEILLEKVCCDVLENVGKCQKTSVVGSISTSLGLLKYRDENLLDALVEWVIKNNEIVRFQDLASLLQTLANVNYTPRTFEEFLKVVLPVLNIKDAPSSNAWLDIVWSLAVCDSVKDDHLISVLNPEFVDKLNSVSSNSSNFAWKKKLLNLNGVAKLTKGYKGPLLEEHMSSLQLVRSKDKQALVTSVIDALTNLVPSGNLLRTDVDSEMGFLIDAECLIDEKMTPLPLGDKSAADPNPPQKTKRGRKVALMVWDYHDVTKGSHCLCGSAALSSALLKKSGYQVLNVSYKDYNFRDKLSDRVSFIERQLRSIVVKE